MAPTYTVPYTIFIYKRIPTILIKSIKEDLWVWWHKQGFISAVYKHIPLEWFEFWNLIIQQYKNSKQWASRIRNNNNPGKLESSKSPG